MKNFLRFTLGYAVIAVVIWSLGMALLMTIGINRFNLTTDNAYNWMTDHNVNYNKSWTRVVSLWDGAWYLSVAQHGYQFKANDLSNVAFLPLYPFLLAALKPIVQTYQLAGLLVNFIALIGTGYWIMKLAEVEKMSVEKGREALWYMLIYPTVVFYAAIYTEALFVCLTVGTFYFLKTKRYWWAGVLGMLAALTRIPGLFLVVPFAYYFYRDGLQWKKVIPGFFIPLGTGIYLLAQKLYTGNALAFLTAQKNWGRHFLKFNPDHVYWKTGAGVVNTSFDILFVVLLILAIWYIYRQLDLGYAAFGFFIIAVPLATGSMMSIGRFGMTIFPIYLALAKSESRWLKNAYVAFGLITLTLYTVQFVNGYWAG